MYWASIGPPPKYNKMVFLLLRSLHYLSSGKSWIVRGAEIPNRMKIKLYLKIKNRGGVADSRGDLLSIHFTSFPVKKISLLLRQSCVQPQAMNHDWSKPSVRSHCLLSCSPCINSQAYPRGLGWPSFAYRSFCFPELQDTQSGHRSFSFFWPERKCEGWSCSSHLSITKERTREQLTCGP